MNRTVLIAIALLAAVAAGTLTSSSTKPPEIPGQLPQIGNGFVSAFVNKSTEYVAGVFNGRYTKSTRAAFPATTRWYLPCTLEKIQTESYPFALDEATATVTVVPHSCGAGAATVSQRFYANGIFRNLMVTEIFVNVTSSSEWCTNFEDLKTPEADLGSTKVLQRASDGHGVDLVVYETLVSETPTSETTLVASARFTENKTCFAPGQQHVARTVTAYVTSIEQRTRDVRTLMDSAYATLHAGLNFNVEELYDAHVGYWGTLWKNSVQIDSPTISPVLRSSQYALFSAVRNNWPFSTSPGGLSTDGYNGHTFWDAETWDLPNLMLMHPDIATGSMFQYRFDRLEGARVNAQSTLGIAQGAAFPWESAFTGENVCPAPMFAMTEIHVTADVVNAIKKYFYLTNDTEFLKQSWNVLNETAAFWSLRSNACQVRAGESVSLDNVTGPDEYHQGNNSAFVNYAVQEAVTFSLEAAKILGIEANSIPLYRCMKNIVQNGMSIPYNATANFHPEYDGYNGSLVKQADTILLNYPLQMPMNESTKLNDLQYYAKRTLPNKSGASTMTWSMFAVGFWSVQKWAEGLHYFYEGFINNAYPPYWQWYQQMGGKGCDNFVTGGGGFIQSVWAGLAAMRIEPEALTIDSQTVYLVPDSTQLNITGVHYRGTVFNVFIRRPSTASSTATPASETYTLDIVVRTAGPNALCVSGVPLVHSFTTSVGAGSATGKISIAQCAK